MNKMWNRLLQTIQATRELGLERAYWYAIYQTCLRSGLYRLVTPVEPVQAVSHPIHSPFDPPEREQLAVVLGGQAVDLINEADKIAGGQVRLFGGPPVPLNLVPTDTAHHWTYYENRPSTWGVEDIKYLWEPARFGWAYLLGRAYALTKDEKYPAVFWKNFETFMVGNPPNQGPNWASAQEVALRLLAMLFTACTFQHSSSSTPERLAALAGAIAAHARRIPPTLSYARAQNNNHRLSEGLGLYAAGCALPEHPEAKKWRAMGWKELNQALQSQIEQDGTYTQHSMNYHRLMLQEALLARLFGQDFPPATLNRLAAATRWLLAQVDPTSGHAPNLGSNDGANILPLSCCAFMDYRPVGQAAARAFLGRAAYSSGAWDEAGLWLGQPPDRSEPLPPLPGSPAVHRLGNAKSWATLRAVRFRSRPAHADQLHVDLWWRGENIALDAGTYRYTAAKPWDNTLAETAVHNTISIDGQNQMLRAGRFLWLEWAQAELLRTRGLPAETIGAQHHGYQRLGVLHRRILKRGGDYHWQVIDNLLRQHASGSKAAHNSTHSYRLSWLLPDWPWALDGSCLTLTRPAGGRVRLTVTAEIPDPPLARIQSISLVRAGQTLAGPKNASPVQGWYSPTYGLKIPALSFSIAVSSPLPLSMISDWILEG